MYYYRIFCENSNDVEMCKYKNEKLEEKLWSHFEMDKDPCHCHFCINNFHNATIGCIKVMKQKKQGLAQLTCPVCLKNIEKDKFDDHLNRHDKSEYRSCKCVIYMKDFNSFKIERIKQLDKLNETKKQTIKDRLKAMKIIKAKHGTKDGTLNLFDAMRIEHALANVEKLYANLLSEIVTKTQKLSNVKEDFFGYNKIDNEINVITKTIEREYDNLNYEFEKLWIALKMDQEPCHCQICVERLHVVDQNGCEKVTRQSCALQKQFFFTCPHCQKDIETFEKYAYHSARCFLETLLMTVCDCATLKLPEKMTGNKPPNSTKGNTYEPFCYFDSNTRYECYDPTQTCIDMNEAIIESLYDNDSDVTMSSNSDFSNTDCDSEREMELDTSYDSNNSLNMDTISTNSNSNSTSSANSNSGYFEPDDSKNSSIEDRQRTYSDSNCSTNSEYLQPYDSKNSSIEDRPNTYSSSNYTSDTNSDNFENDGGTYSDNTSTNSCTSEMEHLQI